MESRCDRRSSNEYAIRGIQKRHWLAIILFGLHQEIRWIVRTSDARTSLFCDRRCLPWVRNLALCLCLAAPLFLWMSYYFNGLLTDPWTASVSPLFMAACVGSLIFSFRLFFGGDNLFSIYEEAIFERIETSGGFLEEHPAGSFNRRAFWQVVYMGYAIAFLPLSIVLNGGIELGVPWLDALVLLVVLGIVPIVILVPVLIKNQATLRGHPMLLGMVTQIAIVFWAAAIVPMYFCADISDDIQNVTYLIHRYGPDEYFAYVAEENAGTFDSSQLEEMYAALRWQWFLWIALGVCSAGSAAVIFYKGVSFAPTIQRSLIRVKVHPGSLVTFRTATGGPLLPWLRYCIGGFAALFCVVVLLATWNSFAIGIFALCNVVITSYPESVSRVVDSSTAIMCAILLRPEASENFAVVSRIGWGIYGFTLPSLLALSVGSLIRSRRRMRRQLLANELIKGSDHDRVLQAVEALAERASVRCPRISVTPMESCEIMCHSFGVIRHEHWIELSQGFVELFAGGHKAAACSAALAHEMAHHRLGHCLRGIILRFVARMMFVGDGFIQAFINSYQDELKADQVAVQEFHVNPADLIKALQLVSNCKAAEVMTSNAALAGTELFPSLPLTLISKSLSDAAQKFTLSERWRCFLSSYTGRDRTSYWHPHRDERIKQLRLLETLNALD